MNDERTPALHLPLPHPDHLLSQDVLRLREALSLIDGQVADKASAHDVQSLLAQQAALSEDLLRLGQSLSLIDGQVADKADAHDVLSLLAQEAAARHSADEGQQASLTAVQSALMLTDQRLSEEAQTLRALDTRLAAQETRQVRVLAYEDRGELRGLVADSAQLALVQGLGMFVFEPGSDEPDDDESCFATATGRWLLEAAHWDVVATWTLAEHETHARQYEALEPLPARLDGLQAQLTTLAQSLPMIGYFTRVLCPITAVAAGTQVSFTVALAPAQPADLVLLTPGDALAARVSCFARVSAPGTVTVYLNNPSSSSQTLTPSSWSLGVLHVLSAP